MGGASKSQDRNPTAERPIYLCEFVLLKSLDLHISFKQEAQMTDEMNRLKEALREGGFPDRVTKTAFIAMMKRPDKTIREH